MPGSGVGGQSAAVPGDYPDQRGNRDAPMVDMGMPLPFGNEKRSERRCFRELQLARFGNQRSKRRRARSTEKR